MSIAAKNELCCRLRELGEIVSAISRNSFLKRFNEYETCIVVKIVAKAIGIQTM